jgi:mannosyltransferase OCH1-like enzyme
MSIPRRIIQTWKSRDLPPLARAGAANLRLLHPDWEYRFFDDDEVRRFVAQEFPRYQAVFDSFPRAIQRFDFFRYLTVFRFGGFYFDLDVLLWQGLADLSRHQCVFPFEELTLNRYLRKHHGIDWEIGNFGFGAAAEDPFLGAVIENCVKAQQDQAWVRPMVAGIPRAFRPEFHVLNSTGPGLVTRTLAENSAAAKNVTVLFPEDVCDSRNWHRFGNYGIHLMDGSWRGRGNVLWRKLALVWEEWTRRRLLVESLAQGANRTWSANAATTTASLVG